MIRGMRGRWNGPPVLRLRRTTSPLPRPSGAAGPCGISSTPKIPIGSTNSMSTLSVSFPEGNLDWQLPSRGRVGMYCLIAAEAAIFTIFVVAYLFYIGKSLTGPQPQDVLQVPILFTICLLSSSLTIHFAVKLLRSGKVRSFARWWLLTIVLG